MAAALAAVLFAGPDIEMQLEAAIHREIVLGDLQGAIGQYQDILAQPGKTRPVAARALFQMGQCFDKLGRRREARDAYSRVVNEYGEQTEVAARARARLAQWEDSLPGPRNLQFEQGVAGKVPPGWWVMALPKEADFLASLHHDGCRTGTGCAVVLAPADTPNKLGMLMQSFAADAYRGKTVRLSAWLRLAGASPGDRAQLWLRVDRPNRQTGFVDDMDDRPVTSPEWTRCEIVARIDDDATFINFAVMFQGRGRVWVDDVSFEVIP